VEDGVAYANPLENLRNTNTIRYVMKNGRLYDGTTLNEIWPRERMADVPYGLTQSPSTAGGER